MAAAAIFGHALLGLGPGVAFFIIILAPKSFVVLLSFFSAFLWLMVLLLTSAILRGFVPIPGTQPAYAGTLLAAVAIEEVARYGVWRLHKITLAELHRMAHASGHTFTTVDELYLAVGWGYGHAAVHVLIMFGSLLPLTAGHGTLYAATCPQMSVFLVAALNSLGMGATLVALSVIALDAWSRGALWGKAFAPLMHAGAALLTLGSMRPGGCVTAVATQLALGLVNTWYAATIAWKRASNASSISSSSTSGRTLGLGAPTRATTAWASSSGEATGAVADGPGAEPGSPPTVRVPGPSAPLVASTRSGGTGGLRSRSAQQGSAHGSGL